MEILLFDQTFLDEVQKRWPNVKVSMTPRDKGIVWGYHLQFPSQFVASIQFGCGHYCSNRDLYDLLTMADIYEPHPYHVTAYDAEIAGWCGSTGPMIQFPGWGGAVLGWQTPEQVLEWLTKYHSLTPEDATLFVEEEAD